ncbi:MAG: carboxy terminal-processing peptidase [Opitutales bacterium]|nr:carboxy terminal-processing peptidase [Opitutales bacterium]
MFVSLNAQQALSSANRVPLQTTPKMRNETRVLFMCMENGHYSRNHLSDLDMREFIREYMNNIDIFKMFFTTSDVQHFQDFFAQSAEIMFQQGTLLPAFSIYDKFISRAEARLDWIKQRMKKPFNLKQTSTFRLDRSKENWPTSLAEADELWDKRLTFDIINEMLSFDESQKDKKSKKDKKKLKNDTLSDKNVPKTYDEKLAKAKEEVLKRYERVIDNWIKFDTIEIQELYLNALTEMFDPHSTFLSEYALEDFDIAIRNSLVGIGATLQEKDGYCNVIELLPGGPAYESKQIEAGDKILAVGQGDDGEMVDVIGMKLRKTVRLIRGQENTKVRLLIEPSSNPSARKIVTLVRKEIKLTTKLAKAFVYTVPLKNKTVPIGVIDLPAFYGESSSDDGSKGFSTSKNVEELLLKLKSFNVQGVILDLRKNGGGFLNEAIDLTGLFIKKGAVVQVRNSSDRVNVLNDENEKIVWDGPLMVLVSRLSASASEIVAGALQDHKRALIVGDAHTHGKGTVQTVCPLSRFDNEQKSAAKFTIQKWYAPSGNSIQLKGVTPDIVLPSIFDNMEFGEQYKDNALRWDSISPSQIEQIYAYGLDKSQATEFVKKLEKQSLERQNKLDEFKFLKERIAWLKERQNKKDWVINYDERKQELKKSEDFIDSVEKREEEFAKRNYKKEEILLDASKEVESKKKESEKEAKSEKKKDVELDLFDDDKEEIFDVQLREALRIMADWIEILQKK